MPRSSREPPSRLSPMILLIALLFAGPLTARGGGRSAFPAAPPAGPAPAAPHSDLLAGTVSAVDPGAKACDLRTADGHEFRLHLTRDTRIRSLRNLGEPARPIAGAPLSNLRPGRPLAAYGTFFPGQGYRFEAQEITLTTAEGGGYLFESPDWWPRQIRELAEFYLRSQFPSGRPDYRSFRTDLGRDGRPLGNARQEATSISRLVYGFATTYLLTGEERFRVAAERGCAYLRSRFKREDRTSGGIYWAHAVDAATGVVTIPSQFREDQGSLPLYEQIYALAGLAQTYRVNGDRRLLAELRGSQRFADAHYLDPRAGGYFSHVDPRTFRPDDPHLGPNASRKNWNSNGDHAPAYLINLYLGSGQAADAARLSDLARIIAARFCGAAPGPFVVERFHSDWSPDRSWVWQQDAAVVGHDLKIVWSLLRFHGLAGADWLQPARQLAARMAACARDRQRGGWYDAIEREPAAGRGQPAFVWHDRKMWWQQEQGILAFYLLAGLTGDAGALAIARDTAAFYNLWFLDHDEGGVHGTVLASGLPYLRGPDRLKGAHWISGYHAFELCFLAHVYTQLLVRRRPVELHFRPVPGAFPDGLLRVAPDLLPRDRVLLTGVWIDGRVYTAFDSRALTVRLPPLPHPAAVRVRLESADDPLSR